MDDDDGWTTLKKIYSETTQPKIDMFIFPTKDGYKQTCVKRLFVILKTGLAVPTLFTHTHTQ